MTRLEQAVTDALRACGMRYGLNWEDLAFAALRAADEADYIILPRSVAQQFHIFAEERRAQGSAAAGDAYADAADFLAKVAHPARDLPPLGAPKNTQWAQSLYDFLLREFREQDESTGEVVTADVRPHFNALCQFLGSTPYPLKMGG